MHINKHAERRYYDKSLVSHKLVLAEGGRGSLQLKIFGSEEVYVVIF